MTEFMNMLLLLLAWVTTVLFYLTLRSFLAARGNTLVQLCAYMLCGNIVNVTIYANDNVNIAGVLLGFLFFVFVFWRGSWIEKVSVVTILYPLIISLNFLTENIGLRIFLRFGENVMWKGDVIRLSLDIVRMALWGGVLWFCRRHMKDTVKLLTGRMWLVIDCVCFAAVVANLVALNFLPKETLVGYPICISSIVTVFGCLYLTSYMARNMQISFQLKALETEHRYYEDKLREEERVRSIYHDLKNHLLILRGEESRGKAGEEMIGILEGQLAGYGNYYHTGNAFLDIIVRDKASLAQKNQIDFSVQLNFEDGSFMEPLDISTLFGNAIDNAIEASVKLPQEQRMITLKANRIRDMLLIFVENNCNETETAYEETSKADKLLHGFGLVNIRKAAEKYQGECTVKKGDGKFTLKVLIPVP